MSFSIRILASLFLIFGLVHGTWAQTPPRPPVLFSIGPNLAADTRFMSSDVYPNTNISILNTTPSTPAGWTQTYASMSWYNAAFADIDTRQRYDNKTFLADMRNAGKKVSIEVAGGFYDGGVNSGSFCDPNVRNNPLYFYDTAFQQPRFAEYGDRTEGFLLANTDATSGRTPVKGQVDYVLIDDPFLRAYDRQNHFNTGACVTQPYNRWDFEFIKGEVIKYMQLLRARPQLSQVKFVLVTSTPHWNYTTPTPTYYPSISGLGDLLTLPTGANLNYKDVLDSFVSAAAAAGVGLDGIIVDYPYNWVTEATSGTAPAKVPSGTLLATTDPEYNNRWGRLSGLVTDAHNRGINAYLFVNYDPGNAFSLTDEPTKSQLFHDKSVAYINDVTSKAIPLDMGLVESWYYVFATGQPPTAPRALLPETEANTFTNSAKDVLSVIMNYNEPVFGVTGYVDGVVSGNLLGWACAKYIAQSITVHVYTGTAAGPVAFYNYFTANQPSEPGVASACQTSFANYRFSIPVTGIASGTYLWVYGISPIGGFSHLLSPQVAVP